MSAPNGRPKERSLPLGGKAHSAKGVHQSAPNGRPKERSLPLGGKARSAKGVLTRAPVLRVKGLTKTFGGVDALRDVSFVVDAGELVALIGPNGAGKTTCFNLLNGQLRPDAGTIELTGTRIDGLPARSIARCSVARTFQVAATFASMTVRENVQIALLARAGKQDSVVIPASLAFANEADALLERVGMSNLRDHGCATLAYGDAKRVELALALAGAPCLLLMDEPTAGMSPSSRTRLMQVAARLVREERIAVLFTEHDMDVVFGFADRVIVLDRGRIIAMGTPNEVRANAQVRAVYLGEDASLER